MQNNKNELRGASTNPSHFTAMNQADRLQTFTTYLAKEIAQTALNYVFSPVMTSGMTDDRRLTEQAIAIFAASYLSRCDCSPIGKQLIFKCPDIETKTKLSTNLQRLRESSKLIKLLDQSGLTEVEEIYLFYPDGNNEGSKKSVIKVGRKN